MAKDFNNIIASDRFDQTHGAQIGELFWIAGNLESDSFMEFLEEMSIEEFLECFPESISVPMDAEDKKYWFINKQKFGLLAEVLYPECSNFRYVKDKERPSSWFVDPSVCNIKYLYAETLEELMYKIEKTGACLFEDFIRIDKLNSKGS